MPRQIPPSASSGVPSPRLAVSPSSPQLGRTTTMEILELLPTAALEERVATLLKKCGPCIGWAPPRRRPSLQQATGSLLECRVQPGARVDLEVTVSAVPPSEQPEFVYWINEECRQRRGADPSALCELGPCVYFREQFALLEEAPPPPPLTVGSPVFIANLSDRQEFIRTARVLLSRVSRLPPETPPSGCTPQWRAAPQCTCPGAPTPCHASWLSFRLFYLNSFQFFNAK
ncbi:uncharacterized protein LOC113206378 [Frankliniella occidentalis]|uniref:Uncharacterized protein LOC113206378 n=1 Tax=Frankliniella occidentalis TaxID=133901 RepID=A0A9C6U2U4_FRAOC|nr:uncharacterized protein LOC113206378 [Frankliniella occidentalis]